MPTRSLSWACPTPCRPIAGRGEARLARGRGCRTVRVDWVRVGHARPLRASMPSRNRVFGVPPQTIHSQGGTSHWADAGAAGSNRRQGWSGAGGRPVSPSPPRPAATRTSRPPPAPAAPRAPGYQARRRHDALAPQARQLPPQHVPAGPRLVSRSSASPVSGHPLHLPDAPIPRRESERGQSIMSS